ncbi:MAG: hypothetical protein OEY41_10370, partial [Acidimicrobiia bacterium]|nr:hypothetical protein [Acidimicrobiia bacterium]
LAGGKKILLHFEEVGDRLAGFVAGYLRWTEMVPVSHEAITVMERILGRQMGPEGRRIVSVAESAERTGAVPAHRRAEAGA